MLCVILENDIKNINELNNIDIKISDDRKRYNLISLIIKYIVDIEKYFYFPELEIPII